MYVSWRGGRMYRHSYDGPVSIPESIRLGVKHDKGTKELGWYNPTPGWLKRKRPIPLTDDRGNIQLPPYDPIAAGDDAGLKLFQSELVRLFRGAGDR